MSLHEQGRASALGAAGWLRLGATPTFAAMALLTTLFGGGPIEAICSAASPLGGMVPMYLLMSAFHASPWVELIATAARRF